METAVGARSQAKRTDFTNTDDANTVADGSVCFSAASAAVGQGAEHRSSWPRVNGVADKYRRLSEERRVASSAANNRAIDIRSSPSRHALPSRPIAVAIHQSDGETSVALRLMLPNDNRTAAALPRGEE